MHLPKYALKNIDLSISKGECVGIVGKNGSGKSTLLKLICNITSPTQGKIQVDGKISSLLELGTGFNPEYTGISNIYLNGSIQGLSHKDTKALIPKIAEFADIGDYIEKPVRTYSDGMFLRLAFSCAVALNPDILIIDEALAVGDFRFRQKCFSKIEEMKKSGATILMVSHDIDSVRRLCERTIWIDDGEIKADGDTSYVSALYMESMTGNATATTPITHSAKDECVNRFGSCIGAVESISFPSVLQMGKPFEFSCCVNIPTGINLENAAVSISVKNNFGLDLSVTSTADSGIIFDKYGRWTINFSSVCHLCAGEYSLCVSLEDRGGNPIKYYDYAEGIYLFRVYSEKDYFGIFNIPTEITLTYGDE